MKNFLLACMAAALAGCVAHVEQYKLVPVASGERADVVAPLKVIEDRGLSKIEWQLLPGTYVERFSSALGRVFLSQGNIVQATTPFGQKTLHPGGWIILKDQPGMAKLYIVRGKSGVPISEDLIVSMMAGVEGDLTLIADFRLADLKRR
jgi:hypothetical protein